MKLLTIEEIKRSQLETMVIFRDFCEKHNLKYYLAFGTLLGAVRHSGFIPWDDDIDILMPRADYDFLIEHFNERIIDRREVISKKTYPEFYLNIAKIIDRNTALTERGQTLKIGVWVDIFPMDYLVDSVIRCVATNIHIGLLWLLAKYAYLRPLKRRAAYKNMIIRIMNTILPSSEQLLNKRMRQINRITSSDKSNIYGLPYMDSEIYGIPMAPASVFEPSIKLKFEGELFSVPRRYDKVLEYFYGKDYMTLPPEEKQASNHEFLCCWEEEE